MTHSAFCQSFLWSCVGRDARNDAAISWLRYSYLKKSLRWVRHPASELNAAVVALAVVDEHSACAQGGEGPLRIWGEDAIVRFPGAQASIIDERDAYMARTIRAAAQGECARLAGYGNG